MQPVNVVVVGSINMDLVVRSSRMPAPGETLIGRSFETLHGGKGANQAVAAARLGSRVQMIGSVGTDDFGARLRDGLKRERVATEFLRSDASTPSGIALIQVDERGENAITVVPGANGRLDLSTIPDAKRAIETADVMLVQLEIPLSTALEAIAVSRRAGVLSVLDPAPAPSSGIPEGLYLADVVSPNQHEAESLTGVKVVDLASASRAAVILRDRGARHVVIKAGAAGAFVIDEKGVVAAVPAFSAKAIDTTAAGDAFTAALGVGLARKMDLVQAARFGCAAGSLAVQKKGAQDAMPMYDEVAALLNQG